MKQHVQSALREASSALEALQRNESVLNTIASAGEALAIALGQGGRIFSCGNGGSMCDAMHFAEELSGRYRLNRRALGATAIGDASHLSCVANDFGYEYVFSRYLEGNGRKGDFLLAISTSGTSKTILNAAEVARAIGMQVIGLHGHAGSPLADLADFDIVTPGGRFADRVQECHIKVIHILIEIVERKLFPNNYGD